MTVHMLLRIRHVLSLPGGDAVWLPSIQYGGMKSAVHRRIVGACCAAADAVVLLTEYQKTQAEQNGIHVPHARVIPYGVDTGRFVFEPLDFSIPLRLISIGSLNKVKNIFLQIETYAILRRSIDCQFTIVGEDIMNGEARRFADSLHVGHLIHWKGQCVHSAIPALLHEAHVLLHTAFFEAEGVVIMEAFSAGTLVVGTRVGLLADTDRDGECTITADDPVHLAEKILSLVADRPLAARIREKNRLASAHMTIDVTAREYAALYNEVIETGLSPRADGRARPGYSG